MANMSMTKNPIPEQEPLVRNKNFDEVALGYTEEIAIDEAKRCLNCPTKPCRSACPVQINIPAFIERVANEDIEGAFAILSESTSLPAVCGRVCPQENQCEGKCVRGIKGEPVGIGRLERFVADYHREHCTDAPVKPEPNGHKVAVIGAGPSGLTVAGDLAKLGYKVTIFEALHLAGGVLVYASEPRSYRDLPLRMGELGLVHRHEKSGQLHGLMRVRCFTQDDAHIFMTPEQIKDEIKGVANLIDQVYKLFGFKYHVELSTRPEDSMGSDEDWEVATEGLRGALDDLGLDYVVNEGDGAFYGPKIDFHLEDSIGRTWQCGTIQLDFQLPQRFEAEYVAEDGTKKRPIMIHRVCFGSIERFIGILIEHFAGKFPVWLAPVQVKVIPVSEKSMEYAQGVYDQLKAAGIRTELDRKDEKVGYKIRQAQLEKVPFMLVLGEKEAAEGKITVRSRDKGDLGVADLSTFIADVKKMTETREK